MHIDIVVGGGATDLVCLSLASRVVDFTVCSARAASHVGATGFALSLVGLFQDADVETEELSRQKVLNHLVVIQQRFFLESYATLQLVVL